MINEDGSVTISGTFTDVGIFGSHTVQIDWGSGEVSSVALVVQGNGSGTFTATHRYLDDSNPANTLSDAYTVTATVVDDGGVSVSSTVDIRVNNVAPTISLLTVTPVIDEDGTINLGFNVSDTGKLDSHSIVINWGDGTNTGYSDLEAFALPLVASVSV